MSIAARRSTAAMRPLRATYRLQLHDGFTFADAAAQVPRLAALGVSHLYLSPSLEAVPGSSHGYDVVDPTRIRASLGGEAGLRALADRAHDAGLGLILDIVPNHVGLVSPINPWWFDTLAHGPDGRFGRHLDVFWQPGAHGQPTLLVPELGERLPEALAGDALQLAYSPDDGRDPAWRIVYHDHAWPVRPGSLAAVGLLAPEHDPAGRPADVGRDDARPSDAEVADAIAACRDDRAKLAALLDRQHYRLGYWRRANDELDHRRFFDIDTLGAVRIEDPAVFDDVHAAVLPLIADGTLDGLRIDHPDGLADPVGYFHRLRDAVGPDTYLVIEKILEHGERFRDDWPVDGTVGYELADVVLQLHVDPAAGEVFDDLQASLTGERFDRVHEADDAKRTALSTLFGAERARLAVALLDADPAAAADTAAADELLSELLIVWPVYRTYIRGGQVDAADVAIVESAIAHAAARRPDLTAGLAVIRALLLDADAAADAAAPADAAERFRIAFQQLTGPAIAKGLEDTVLYRDTRFVAVNEVGSDPGHLGAAPADLHAANIEVAGARPRTMRLLSTHDTKRSADVRARLSVLSQRPERWVAHAARLRALAARHRTAAGPSPAHEHLAWQTAVGAWPIDAERLAAYLVKAAREGKQRTDWLEPDAAYEDALTGYAQALCTDPALVAAIDAIVAELTSDGWATSLSMVLLTLTGPGVPDIYQGDERWALTLVDPDNRRPVDHDALAAALDALPDEPSPAFAAERWAAAADGDAKSWLTRQALQVRAGRPASFDARAAYEPMWATGRHRHHVLAYRRGSDVIAVSPVRIAQLRRDAGTPDWDDTGLTLPDGAWRDVLTGRVHPGGPIRLATLLASFPVALLVAEPDDTDPGSDR